MFDKMKTLFDMQKKMQEMKRELEGTTFEAKSSDGLVKITMNGSQQVLEVNIQANLQQTDKGAFEQAIKDAYNSAIKQSHELAKKKMQDVTGLNLPGLI